MRDYKRKVHDELGQDQKFKPELLETAGSWTDPWAVRQDFPDDPKEQLWGVCSPSCGAFVPTPAAPRELCCHCFDEFSCGECHAAVATFGGAGQERLPARALLALLLDMSMQYPVTCPTVRQGHRSSVWFVDEPTCQCSQLFHQTSCGC